MAASTTDLISKVTSGSYAAPARVQTARSSGVTTLLCDALTGWDTTTLQFFVTYRLDGAGKVIAGSEVAWTGIVSGNSITTMVATAGTDAGNQVGDIVVAMPTHESAKRLAQAILASHNQDGTLKDGVVTNVKLSTVAGELGGASQAWTPTISGITVGAGGTLTCKYTQVGKTVRARVFFKFGTGSAITGDIFVPLPLTAAAYSSTSNITQIGQASAFDGASIFFGSVAMASTIMAAIRFIATGSTYAAAVTASATVPMTWNTNHELTATFEYEAA